MGSSVEGHVESSVNVRRRTRDDVGESPDWDMEVAKLKQLDGAEEMRWVGRGTTMLEVGERWVQDDEDVGPAEVLWEMN